MSIRTATIAEAAAALSVSERHIRRLVDEALVDRRSRWRFGRELIDLTPSGSERRVVRVNLARVLDLESRLPTP